METDEGRQAIGGISRRSVLRGGLLAGTGLATVGAASAFLTGTARATVGWQFGWGYCIYCSAMFFTQVSVFAPCPGSPYNPGQHNTGSENYVYQMWHDESGLMNSSNPQPNWRFCDLCDCLFWAGNAGHCWGNQYGYGSHQQISGSYNYDNYWASTIPGSQLYWRYCKNCSELYYQGPSGSSAGVCPLPAEQIRPPHEGGATIYTMFPSGSVFA
jgi:hypothetical protein